MALATVESFKKPRPKNALQLFPDFDGTVHPACLHRQRARARILARAQVRRVYSNLESIACRARLLLATDLGPSSAVNSGPSAAVCWTDVMGRRCAGLRAEA